MERIGEAFETNRISNNVCERSQQIHFYAKILVHILLKVKMGTELTTHQNSELKMTVTEA